MLHENEANRKQGKQHSNGLIFWSSKAEYLFKKKKEVKQIHCTLNENPMLCLGIKTHNPLPKPFIFSLTLLHLIFTNVLTIDCLLICFLCYVL